MRPIHHHPERSTTFCSSMCPNDSQGGFKEDTRQRFFVGFRNQTFKNLLWCWSWSQWSIPFGSSTSGLIWFWSLFGPGLIQSWSPLMVLLFSWTLAQTNVYLWDPETLLRMRDSWIVQPEVRIAREALFINKPSQQGQVGPIGLWVDRKCGEITEIEDNHWPQGSVADLQSI